LLEFLYVRLPEDIKRLEDAGYLDAAVNKIKQMLNMDLPPLLKKRLEYELEVIRRIKFDYPYDDKEAFEILSREIENLTREQFEKWINEGYVDFVVINGKRRFFRRFAANLFFLCKDAEKLRKRKDGEVEKRRKILEEHVKEILSQKPVGYLKPRRVRIKMRVTLKPNAVPAGEIVRAWLPFPREGDLQTNVKLIRAFPENYQIAPNDAPQRTIYFEQEVEENKPTIFEVEYEYVVRAFYLKIDPEKVRPYDEDSEIYKKYTKEQPPHILFTHYLRDLVEEIVGDEENPYKKAEKIYQWITTHVRYTYVPNYGIFENIPEFVARNLRGDCGFYALLFITLCRIAGIPARWQSGWYCHPLRAGPHDWAQFYIEPYGWLYADLSFGSSAYRRNNETLHKFYFGNIDAFRTAFNIDIMSEFVPKKKFIRSDPVDNQVGELEWRKGNIYYDQFDYEIQIVEQEFI